MRYLKKAVLAVTLATRSRHRAQFPSPRMSACPSPRSALTGMVGPSAKPVPWRHSQRRCQHRIDLCVAVDTGPGALPSGQLADRRHLRPRIEVGNMAREPEQVAQSRRPGCMTIGRRSCPFIASLIVTILILRFSMEAAKSATSGGWSSYIQLLAHAQYTHTTNTAYLTHMRGIGAMMALRRSAGLLIGRFVGLQRGAQQ
ncbi:hypothetical protein ABIF86_000352 [Bradyrhizobium japonicum]